MAITQDISREVAIRRIKLINGLSIAANYDTLMGHCDEYYDREARVEDIIPVDTSNIDNWSNKMLATQLEKRFWRFSSHHNYCIHPITWSPQ